MKFTDTFIQRPVLAMVVSLLIFLVGLRAIYDLQVRQYPYMSTTVITVTTSYPGADASLIQGFITTPIEKSIATAEGIDYITSSSTQGTSSISVYVKLNYDPNTAFTDVMAKVQQVMNQLPKAAQNPVIVKSTGSRTALMYIGFSSAEMSSEQITDYLTRVVQPKLETIEGVAEAQILGNHTFAMRIWLDAAKMAAFNVTSNDVDLALQANNFQSASGSTKGVLVAYNVNADTDLHDPKAFANMVVKQKDGAIVRLKDIANVELGSQDYDSSVIFNGQSAIFIGIQGTPTGNPLTTIEQVRSKLPDIEKSLPPSLKANIVYDSTKYISASIAEVMHTIAEATVIVIIVIFLFLGSIRSVVIPVVTIPLSLIGVCSLMLALGYSINLLTLLALVLAIGLVVDDAIVVVENIHRHMEEGMPPFDAAIRGAREIALPVIAMTITLAAVYAPIGFMGGLTGSLFKEFAFTLASAVIISGVIALTLSPMMCSKIFKAETEREGLSHRIDVFFEKIKEKYHARLHNALNYRPVTYLFAIVILVSCFFLYVNTSKELAPTEDQSVLFVSGTAQQNVNIDYVEKFSQQMGDQFKSLPGSYAYFLINGAQGVNSVFGGVILQPWNERKLSQNQILPILQGKLSSIAGLQTAAFPLPPLPSTSRGLPVEFILNTTEGYPALYKYAEQMKQAALNSGLFMYVDDSLKFNNPQIDLHIDRDKAALLGITMQDVGNTLATALGGNYINWFSMQGQSYQVIPEMQRSDRLDPAVLNNYYLKTVNGDMVPLSTIVTISQSVAPNELDHFQQLNSATIEGVLAPDVTMGTALDYLRNKANEILPRDVTYGYGGESRQYVQEGNALLVTLIFAIIIIYLVLAAQFESFRDPLIILISVPMSICGALIPLNLGIASINIYTQIGLITLVGLISKHGILMVEFANKLQEHEGMGKREAIERSASIRLRPILMTTASMVCGVLPLLLSSGAGATSRFCIGLVIATGMLIGTMFTLFVVPTMYMLFAKDHQKQKDSK